jgi:hypothetical protein
MKLQHTFPRTRYVFVENYFQLYQLLLLLLLLLVVVVVVEVVVVLTAIELSLGGITDKTSKKTYTLKNNTKTQYKQYKTE